MRLASFVAVAVEEPNDDTGDDTGPIKSYVKGQRVKRGKDWKWDDQDGGAGYLGTVVDEGGGKWVKVLWDKSHTRADYRIGHDGCFDLVGVAGASSGPVKSYVKNQRVKRGKDWKWSDQDGGAGKLGTIVGEGR